MKSTPRPGAPGAPGAPSARTLAVLPAGLAVGLPRGLTRWCLLAVLLLVLLQSAPLARALSLCKPLTVPDDCQFGLVRDFCGRTVCAKGPGDRCGGPSNIHGKCGEGMHCKCERCIGCSLHSFTCDLGSVICM